MWVRLPSWTSAADKPDVWGGVNGAYDGSKTSRLCKNRGCCADHKPPSCLSVPAMGPVPLHTAECIYNRKPRSHTHTHTHTHPLSALSAGSHFSAFCVCVALWQPDHVTITPLRCHKHCLFNTAVLSLSACKRRGGVIVERGRDGEEWEQAAKEGFVVACVFTGRGPLWHSLSEKQQMHAWRQTSAEFTDQ